jgi:hypothetical protein
VGTQLPQKIFSFFVENFFEPDEMRFLSSRFIQQIPRLWTQARFSSDVPSPEKLQESMILPELLR